MVTFTKPVCEVCGSDQVKGDAHATWNTTTQEWEVCVVYDKGHVCEGSCGGETRLEYVKLKGKELREARAHHLAIGQGWLPQDEDTAIEYCDMEDLDYRHKVEGEE